MLQFLLILFIMFGCAGAEESAAVSSGDETQAAESSPVDKRDRSRSRDLIITMEFDHNASLKTSELWVGSPISVEFGEIKSQTINLHVSKGDDAEKYLDPQKGRVIAKLRFAIGDESDAKSHGFTDGEGRHWALKSVSPGKDILRHITLLVKLRKPRLDQGQRIWKGDMLKVEKGQFSMQPFMLSVTEGNAFDKTLAYKSSPLKARVSFKRTMRKSKPSNGFIDLDKRVWEIAHAELVR